MGESFTICSTLPTPQRAALEHLLYFNVNQERMRLGIQKSIDSYGVPEIPDKNGTLSIRVGSIQGVQTLFAVSEYGHPMGVAIFVRSDPERIVVLHLGVLPRLWSKPDVNAQVLLELVHEIHSAAKQMKGVDRIDVVYSQRCSSPQVTG